jgi:hypothetical protein
VARKNYLEGRELGRNLDRDQALRGGQPLLALPVFSKNINLSNTRVAFRSLVSTTSTRDREYSVFI